MRQFWGLGRKLLMVGVVLALTVPAQATSINGGGGLLTIGQAAQLESWLGMGALQFTNIFTKGVGDNAASFHTAADGVGPTFSIIEVTGNFETSNFSSPVIIGGYNPQSWDSSDMFHITPAGSRDAFIFNLTTPELRMQNQTTFFLDSGQYQTFNSSGSGPSFGAGDIRVFDSFFGVGLGGGDASSYSYGTEGGTIPVDRSQGLAGPTNACCLTFGQIEVFTISPDTASVPEPSSLLLLGLGLVGLMTWQWKRQQNVS